MVLSNLCAMIGYIMPSSIATHNSTSLSSVLHALNLCLTSTLISVTSLLNYSLAAFLCVFLVLPSTLLSPHRNDSRLVLDTKHLILIGIVMVILNVTVNSQTLWDWSVLEIWFAPFICIVCAPLLLQAAIVCSLPL